MTDHARLSRFGWRAYFSHLVDDIADDARERNRLARYLHGIDAEEN